MQKYCDHANTTLKTLSRLLFVRMAVVPRETGLMFGSKNTFRHSLIIGAAAGVTNTGLSSRNLVFSAILMTC